MDACLPLCDEMDSRSAVVRIGDEPRQDRRRPHLPLLRSFPTVWVREHELDLIFDSTPYDLASHRGLLDVLARAREEVLKEVGEDTDNRLAHRERGEVPFDRVRRVESVGAEMKFESVTGGRVGQEKVKTRALAKYWCVRTSERRPTLRNRTHRLRGQRSRYRNRAPMLPLLLHMRARCRRAHSIRCWEP